MAEREGRSEYGNVDLVGDETVKQVAVAAVLAALTAALAQVSIPLPGLPAPISFQLFGVYFAGLLLGARWGGFSVALYLLVGAAGAPVFSNGSGGLGVLLGPTGGYLFGYLLAAVVIGLVVHRGLETRSLTQVPVWLQAGALLLGLAIIYALGVPWLAETTSYSLEKSIQIGMVIFVPGDLLKIAATIGVVRAGLFDAVAA
ncbi:biotin transporter BioY [Haloarchaeobius amylolyticus]|uniref:biotin transporter BioY n=1 Tax=Haloarchaeobius amylolyticus TaxID=1198296 RepID=UPI00226EDA3E|nr:biotin transporter BioY [Haloarchaeobius amylolyticus]